MWHRRRSRLCGGRRPDTHSHADFHREEAQQARVRLVWPRPRSLRMWHDWLDVLFSIIGIVHSLRKDSVRGVVLQYPGDAAASLRPCGVEGGGSRSSFPLACPPRAVRVMRSTLLASRPDSGSRPCSALPGGRGTKQEARRVGTVALHEAQLQQTPSAREAQ